MSLFEGCPGAKIIKQPIPQEVRCTCGQKIEIWSDEISADCNYCHRQVVREVLPSCLDWCRYAKECAGERIYNNFLNNKSLAQSK